MQGPGSELGAAWSAWSWKIGRSEEETAFGLGLYCVFPGCTYSPAGCSTEHGAGAAALCLGAALGSVTSPPHSPALPKTISGFHPRSLPLTHVDLLTASRLNLWFPWKKPYSRRPLGDSQQGAWYYSQMMFHPLIPYVYIM